MGCSPWGCVIGALEHCRENAHDKIRPISSIGQVGARRQAGPGLDPLLEKLGKPRPREGQRVGAGIRSQILTVEEARHSFPHQLRGSPPGSPVPGILQARTLEWVAISSSNA